MGSGEGQNLTSGERPQAEALLGQKELGKWRVVLFSLTPFVLLDSLGSCVISSTKPSLIYFSFPQLGSLSSVASITS